MTSRERALIYSILGLILAANILILFGRAGQEAFAAGPEPSSANRDDLGPADALVLTGEKELVIRNYEGRAGWAQNAHGRAYSIAFVDVQDILEKLMETPVYREEREALTQEIQGQEDEWREKFRAFEEKYADATENDPRAGEIRTEWSELNTQYRQWREAAQKRQNELGVAQLERAYEEIVEAVNIVADERQIDLVFRFTPEGTPLGEARIEAAQFDIRTRPVVRYPDDLDITVYVLDEMALEEE